MLHPVIPNISLRLLSLGLAAALQTLTPTAAQAGEGADIVARQCASCHQQNGNSTDPAYPKLAGKETAYLSKQLRDFVSGGRRNDIMTPIATALGEEKFSAVASYFNTQKPSPGTPGDRAKAEAGKPLYEDGNTESGVPACAGCHQANGSGNARFPRLAGQHARYIKQQLLDFKSGRRSNDRMMVSIGQRLTPEEIDVLSHYIAGL